MNLRKKIDHKMQLVVMINGLNMFKDSKTCVSDVTF